MMKLDRSWHSVLEEELKEPYVQDLKAFLDAERVAGKIIYPPESLVFHAFSRTPWDKVRVVIVGQDPYHGPGQAHGLSFSVPHGIEPPPSLKNIFQEIVDDVGIPYPQTGCLISWAEQGVLLLNATLTVRHREPGSHAGRGWERFTDAVIAKIAQEKPFAMFVLWGKAAKEKCANVLVEAGQRHRILTAPHPSPYSARSGFFGCGHFSEINRAFVARKEQPIDWRLSAGRDPFQA